MPDISMCLNRKCPHKFICYRFMAKPSQHQCYGDFKLKIGNQCDSFIPVFKSQLKNNIDN